jgi:hypothetical protein
MLDVDRRVGGIDRDRDASGGFVVAANPPVVVPAASHRRAIAAI